MDSQFLCEISSLQRVWAWIKRTFLGIIIFSSTEAQFLGDFSSTQAGRPYVKCTSKIEQDFMHRISECWPNHFIPSGMHLNQAYFPNNSKVFPHRISVSWQNLCVPCMTRLFHAYFSCYTKGFMHAISESCRILFNKSGMHLYWTDFSGYSKISARILRLMENSFRSTRDAL